MGTVCAEGCECYLGNSILGLVVQKLREGNIAADTGYPGQKFPAITGPVAAVHLEKVDRANQTVTVEVDILCPASLGGAGCELEALRATELLHRAGAACIQSGCSYDGAGQVYAVAIQATFTASATAGGYAMGPGFTVFIAEEQQPWAAAFSSEETAQNEVQYGMGESEPVGISSGSRLWEITLEEQIPTGAEEAPEPDADFNLKIVTDSKTEIYTGCRWVSLRREFSGAGLRRIRRGIAMSREEA